MAMGGWMDCARNQIKAVVQHDTFQKLGAHWWTALCRKRMMMMHQSVLLPSRASFVAAATSCLCVFLSVGARRVFACSRFGLVTSFLETTCTHCPMVWAETKRNERRLTRSAGIIQCTTLKRNFMDGESIHSFIDHGLKNLLTV